MAGLVTAPLLPIFRSQHQALLLLAELLLHPDEELSLTDLAKRLHMPLSTVHLETGRLVESGIISERLVGRSRLLRANRQSRLFQPLTDLLMVTYGPATVVTEEFRELHHLRGLYIFGSWAARYSGQRGPAPNDVDVLVIGDRVSRLATDAAAQRAEDRLRVPVNAVLVTSRRWADASDLLVTQLRSASIVTLVDDTAPALREAP